MMQPLQLREVCDITMGQAPDGESYNDRGSGWPLIAGAGDFGVLHPAPKKYTTTATRLTAQGDIVLGIRASIGEKVLADGEYCLGRGVAGLRPKPQLDSRFLWHWLTLASPTLVGKARGATFKQVNKDDIGELELKLPALAQQRRIAAILDQADALRAKRRKALAQLDKLTHAIFVEVFGDPQDQIDGGHCKALATVTDPQRIVTYGIVQAGPEVAAGVPYIKTGDIRDGEILEHQLSRTSAEIADAYRRSSLKANDIVISIRATVGTTALVPPSLEGANLTQGTARIAAGDSLDPLYLIQYIRTPTIQRWIAAQVKGATFREITLGRLRTLPVFVPSWENQQRFRSRALEVAALRRIAVDAQIVSDQLFASLQHRAFRGEL